QVQQMTPRVRIGSGGTRHVVVLTDVLAGPMQSPQQIAQMRVERDIAVIAAQPSRVAEVPQCAAARRAALPVVRRRDERSTRPTAFPEGRQEAAYWSPQDRAARRCALLLSA